jgi:short-subunit dehydrogenase
MAPICYIALMKSIALITGASSGIGREFARLFAADKIDLVLVARDGAQLEKVAQELRGTHGVFVKSFAADLSDTRAIDAVYGACRAEELRVQYLVNNAGVGDFGFFAELDWKRTEVMMNLNMKAVTKLCRLFLPAMIAQKSGRILNVASTAAFQPGPLMAVYYATKSYVLFLTETMHNELGGTGVTATCLCPGPTQTGFQAAAQMEESKLFRGKKLPTAHDVAQFGYRAMHDGKMTAIYGFNNALLTFLVRFLPRALVLTLARRAQEKIRS